MESWEVVVVLVLVGPLVFTLLVITANFASTGLKDLRRYVENLQKGDERPLPEDTIPDAEVDIYIRELKKEQEKAEG